MKQGGRWWKAVVMIGLLGLTLGGCGERATAGLEELPERLAADGTTVVVGDPKAPLTVRMYEDPRCPYCEKFEQTGGGPALRRLTEQRKVKTEYTLASFLDDGVGGSGSKKAVNALRAALDAGKFAEYHAVLYEHQPEEAVDGFTDAYLLELAGKVKGLRSPAFDAAVKNMKYRAFVTKSERAYERADGGSDDIGPGTPTAVINGKQIPDEYAGVLYDEELFGHLLDEVGRRPGEWEQTGLPLFWRISKIRG